MVGSKDQLQVVLADKSTTNRKIQIYLKIKLAKEQYLHVECNIIRTLCIDFVLGMPFLMSKNLLIDWNNFVVKFKETIELQAVPMVLG